VKCAKKEAICSNPSICSARTRRRPNPAGRLAKWGQVGDILSSPASAPRAAHPHAVPNSVHLALPRHPPRNGVRGGGTSPAGDVRGRFARCKVMGGASGGLCVDAPRAAQCQKPRRCPPTHNSVSAWEPEGSLQKSRFSRTAIRPPVGRTKGHAEAHKW
jgi:hypothetical protein